MLFLSGRNLRPSGQNRRLPAPKQAVVAESRVARHHPRAEGFLAWCVVGAPAYEAWREGVFLKQERFVSMRGPSEHSRRVQEKL